MPATSVYVGSTVIPSPALRQFAPLIVQHGKSEFVAVFTSKLRMLTIEPQPPACVELVGAKLFDNVPAECGIVVNPGSAVGIELSPDGVVRIRQDFKSHAARIINAEANRSRR